MENNTKKNPNKWAQEEMDKVVGAFQWLLDQDREQNPHLYAKKTTLEKGRNEDQKELK